MGGPLSDGRRSPQTLESTPFAHEWNRESHTRGQRLMPNIVYFAHSYRPTDADVNDYFARLMKSEQLIPSLDPPSDAVNSAKLERHLNYSDGMVAILTY